MSAKTGRRATARKPVGVRRRNAKTAGAFGKEGLEEIVPSNAGRNLDKAARRHR